MTQFGTYVGLVRRNADFRRLYVARLVSFAGDWFLVVPLVGLVYEATNSALAAAAVLAAQALPASLLAPLTGAVSDRFDRKRILVISDLLRAGLAMSLLAVDAVGGAWFPLTVMLLEGAMKAKLNILISGGTGSGKTTLLNTLSSFIGHEDRIVTIEDAAELQLQQDHIVRLETRPPNIEGNGAVTATDLVKNALRMRPERIVVGECRGGESLDMLQAMNTGHDGSMGTLHANSPREALSRLESMIAMGGAIAYASNHWTALTNYLLDGRITDITNNAAERALRHWVIARRISHGTRTPQGTHAFSLLASVIETCRQRAVSPWPYLAEVVTQRRKDLRAPALPLPAN